MSLVYLGLVMTSQPPFDPGYSGKVIVMVHNLSSQPHHLKRGSRMATIEFSRVGSLLPATNPPTHRSVVDLLGQLTAPVSSSLTDIAKSAASAQKRVQWLVAQMVIFATLLLAMAAVPALSAYSIFSDRQAEQKVRIDELTKSVADNNLAMDSLKQKLVEAVDEHELLVEHLKRQTSDVQPLNRAKTAVVGGTPAKQQQ